MIDRPGMIKDLQAMAVMATRQYYRTPAPDPFGEPVTWGEWSRALFFADQCESFARELERRETGENQ